MFFVLLGRLPLIEPDEGRNAEVAREMLAGGDWLVPHYDGFAYLDKPPVLFWADAVDFEVLGTSELAARLPSALAALGVVFITWLLALQMFDKKAAIYSGIVFAVAPLAVVFSRYVIFDMPLTLFVTGALACYWAGGQSKVNRRGWALAFFALMGIATLTKGPVGFLIPLLVIVVYCALRRRLSDLSGLPWGLGALIFSVIVLPWFIAVSVRYPDFPRYALLRESVERFLTPEAHRSGNLFYYIPVFLAGFFPWSFFLIFAAVGKLRKWETLAEEKSAPAIFLITWAVVVFVFFSFSHSKLPGYFLPALVPLSILMGTLWGRSEAGLMEKVPDWMTAGLAMMILMGLVLLSSPEWTRFASFHVRLSKKLPPDVLALLVPSLVYSGVILIALGVIGRNLLSRVKRKSPAWAAFALVGLSFPLILLRSAKPLGLYANHNSSRKLARTILNSPERNLPIYGYYYFRTGLPFYLKRPVGLVTSGADELTSNFVVARWPHVHAHVSERIFPGLAGVHGWPDSEPVLVRYKGWRAQSGPWPVLVLVQNNQVSDFAANSGKLDPLWTEWGYSVWKYAPRGH